MFKCGVWMVGSLLCVASAAHAADISGQVTLTGNKPTRDAVVYLEGLQKAIPLPKAVVDQRAKTFIPHVSVITRGTTVSFPNNDSVYHNVFAYFDAKKFDLGLYPHGTTRRQTFEKTGVVDLLCNIHSDMSAFIVVVDTPYFAVTDKQGRFRIKDVAPGTYTVRGWHESGAASAQSYTVTAQDGILNVTLSRK